MATPFYAASSVNVQPDPSQFQFHLPTECDQSCHNTFGSYKCSCVSGYQLAADGKSCLGKINFTWKLFGDIIISVAMDFCRNKKMQQPDQCVRNWNNRLSCFWCSANLQVAVSYFSIVPNQLNPFHPSLCKCSIPFSIQFLEVHTSRIWSKIKSFHSCWSLPLFSWP